MHKWIFREIIPTLEFGYKQGENLSNLTIRFSYAPNEFLMACKYLISFPEVRLPPIPCEPETPKIAFIKRKRVSNN